jgi:hypothetical protein
LASLGELRVSPKAPTAPPLGLTSAWATNESSSSSKRALAQLMLIRTGSCVPFVSAFTSAVPKSGLPQPSLQP